MSISHPLEVVGRGSETQLQVGSSIIWIHIPASRSNDDDDRDQIVHKWYPINPYNAEIVLFKLWRPNKIFSQFEIIINVLVSSFCFIWMYLYVMGLLPLFSFIGNETIAWTSKFLLLEIVGRGSETQLQVGEYLKPLA